MYHYSKPTISEKDIENVVKVLRSEYLTQGPITNEFERRKRTVDGIDRMG